MLTLPDELVELIHLNCDSARPFLRQVCEHFRKILSIKIDNKEWLEATIMSQDLRLLQLGLDQGCILDEKSFSLAIQSDSIQMIEFMSDQWIHTNFAYTDIKSIEILTWLSENEYESSYYEEDAKFELNLDISLPILEKMSHVDCMDLAILVAQNGNSKIIFDYMLRYPKRQMRILTYSSFETFAELIKVRPILSRIKFDYLFESYCVDALKKARILISKGIILNRFPSSNINDLEFVKFIQTPYGTRVAILSCKYTISSLEILKWRVENGDTISLTISEDVTIFDFCVESTKKYDTISIDGDEFTDAEVVRKFIEFPKDNIIPTRFLIYSQEGLKYAIENWTEDLESYIDLYGSVCRVKSLGLMKLLVEKLGVEQSIIEIKNCRSLVQDCPISMVNYIYNLGLIYDQDDIEEAISCENLPFIKWYSDQGNKLIMTTNLRREISKPSLRMIEKLL